jgi:hypothetical protein
MSKILTKDILSKKIFTDSAGRKYFNHTEEFTNQFDTIEDEAANILSKAQAINLYLNGLAKINEASAKKLAQAKISALFLNGLRQLPIQAAVELGKAKCDIYLEGLEELNDSCLEALAKCKAGLSLGIFKLSEGASAKLGERKKGHLYLSRIAEISDEAAKNLAKHKGGNLGLDGLKKLSDEGVEYLCEHQSVSMTGLLEVSDKALGHMLTAHQQGMALSLDGRIIERIRSIRAAREKDNASASKNAATSCEDDVGRWAGPLSLSIGFKNGDYVNANLTKGIEDYGVLEAILRCKKILKKPQKGDGFRIGWCDLSDQKNSGGSLDQDDEGSALVLFADIEDFIRSSPSKKAVKRNKK